MPNYLNFLENVQENEREIRECAKEILNQVTFCFCFSTNRRYNVSMFEEKQHSDQPNGYKKQKRQSKKKKEPTIGQVKEKKREREHLNFF